MRRFPCRCKGIDEIADLAFDCMDLWQLIEIEEKVNAAP